MKRKMATKEPDQMLALISKSMVWCFLNDAKVRAVKSGFTRDQLVSLKQECDDLFRQVTGCLCHPAWWIGGWGDAR
jgi:hypothetical protein